MTILLTGSTGFLGTRIADELRLRGVGWRALRARLHETARADLADVSTVVHCAALAPAPGRSDEEFFAANADGTRHLLERCEESGVRRFVHVSSMAVKFASAYARSKRSAEEHVRRSAVEWLVLRPAQVFGPTDDLRRTFDRLKSKIVWSLLASGLTPMHIVYVRDCARAIADAALSDRARETFNIIGPEYSELEYFRAMRKVVGARLLFLPRPLFRVRTRALPADSRAVVGLRTPGVADWPLAATPLETALRECYETLTADRSASPPR